MDTARQRQVPMSYRHSPATTVAAGTHVRAPKRAPEAPPRRRSTAQLGKTIAMVLLALLAASLGMAYLACCANVAAQGYRQHRLERALNQEKDLLVRLQGQKYTELNPMTIEKKATALGMVPVTDKNTYILK